MDLSRLYKGVPFTEHFQLSIEHFWLYLGINLVALSLGMKPPDYSICGDPQFSKPNMTGGAWLTR